MVFKILRGCMILKSPFFPFGRLFGKKDTQYDFGAVDFGKLKEKACELEEAQKGMKKKVNPKVLNMIDRCVGAPLATDGCLTRKMYNSSVEKRETALKKMLATVLKDKEKIEETIEELDRYKCDALQRTCQKVNR
jgi:structural maintenance of chromosome 2